MITSAYNIVIVMCVFSEHLAAKSYVAIILQVQFYHEAVSINLVHPEISKLPRYIKVVENSVHFYYLTMYNMLSSHQPALVLWQQLSASVRQMSHSRSTFFSSL